jgi:predicted nucleic acid-binding protein
MKFLLDTSTLNHLIRGRQSVVELAEARVRRGDDFLLASPAHFELTRYLELKGAAQLIRSYRKLTRFWSLVDLTFSDWSEAALLWADRHREGRAISDFDLLLAVLARREDAVLVTANTRHFEGLGVALEDWAPFA